MYHDNILFLLTSHVLVKVLFHHFLGMQVEVEGMREAHLRDAVALCGLLSFLEKEVQLFGMFELYSCQTKPHTTLQSCSGFATLDLQH